jgi:quercetin dioxygenase-like cupin family protein
MTALHPQPVPARKRIVMLTGVALLAIAAIAGGQIGSHRQDHPSATASVAGGHTEAVRASQGIVARIVSDEALPGVPGKRVIVELVDFPPGASAPEHHHGGAVTAYVLSGTIRSGLNGEPPLDYPPEATFFEPDGTVHTVTMNPSATEHARFLAIHVVAEGVALTTYH